MDSRTKRIISVGAALNCGMYKLDPVREKMLIRWATFSTAICAIRTQQFVTRKSANSSVSIWHDTTI